MISNSIINISCLGKRYLIEQRSRANPPPARYDTLRDVIENKLKSCFSRNRGESILHELWALRDIDLTVGQGERLAIIGHNGAGKSTLLKILSRVTAPSTGSVTMRGRISSLLEVGTGFHPELSGRENIYLNGSILGMTKNDIKSQFDAIVEFSGVGAFLDVPLKRYSSGMAARLGFAVAAHLQSEIMIVDEVLAVGDIAFQKKCLGKMDEASRQEGKTILFVSHNINAMKRLCNRGVILSNGRLEFDGCINAAVDRYVETVSQTNGLNIKAQHEDIEIVRICSPSNVSAGDDWSFAITLRTAKPLRNCYFDFGIYNREISPILHFMGANNGMSFDVEEGEFTLHFTVRNVTLSSGTYLLGFYLATTGGKVLLDVLEAEAATVIDVPPYTGGSALIANSVDFSLAG